MHLAERAYALVVLTAVLIIAGTWSSDPAFAGLWRWPAALLLLGLALEGVFVRRTPIHASVDTRPRALLGREQPAAFTFANPSNRTVTLEYAATTPLVIEPLGYTHTVTAPRGGTGRDTVTLLPVRLGLQRWPTIPARVLGRFGLAWWTRTLAPECEISVAPDTLRAPRRRPSGKQTGMRPRRTVGAGSELHQLRSYVPGDALARIDWKATARTRKLITREFSEDQHLDVLVAIDAGRLSRVRAGRLDRFGLYANIAARFAEVVTPNDDRIGLVVFSDRTLVMCPPDRGMAAIMRIRRALEQLTVQAAESDPVAAAARIRAMLKHRSLIVLLTDLDDAAVAEQLARAVRMLCPPHLVVVAGVQSVEINELARREARSWRDPWIALAAQEHEARAAAQRALLRRLGAPVIATREELLEQSVFDEYEALRRSRRI
ncbi:MAG TPA: DUF58 domain-containing protein [Steroidobacteraceae bacterium]|jgi:uncharacterized protein (DUF58 family)|nr:DUF58 domain-containing protein [Steroidobacteraceae bacterium]